VKVAENMGYDLRNIQGETTLFLLWDQLEAETIFSLGLGK
jgi:hypothetical protein